MHERFVFEDLYVWCLYVCNKLEGGLEGTAYENCLNENF